MAKTLNFSDTIFALLLALFVMARGLPSISLPYGDPGTYIFLGSQVLDGKVLYVDLWEHKGPVLFLINALGLWLASDSRWGIWLIEFVFVAFSLFILYRYSLEYYGALPAAMALTVGAIIYAGFIETGNWSEEYSIGLNLAALWLLMLHVRGKIPSRLCYILVGLLAGLGAFLLLKDIGLTLTVGLALSVHAAIRQKKFPAFFGALFWMFVGTMLITLPICIYFILVGGFLEMMEHVFIYSFRYAIRGDILSLPLWPSIRYIAAWLGWVFGLLALGYTVSLHQAWRDARARTFSPQAWILVVLLPVEVVAVSVGKAYLHYYIVWLPVIILSIAAAISWLINKLGPRFRIVKLTHLVPIFGLAILLAWPGAAWPNYIETARLALAREPLELTGKPLTDYIARHTAPEETIQVWTGNGVLYFFSQRQPASKYIYYPYMIDEPDVERYAIEYLEAIQSNPPVYFVDTSKIYPDAVPSLDPETRRQLTRAGKTLVYYPPLVDDIMEYISQHYEFEIEIDNYRLYRLKDLQGSHE
jgi:hypothetical protein